MSARPLDIDVRSQREPLSPSRSMLAVLLAGDDLGKSRNGGGERLQKVLQAENARACRYGKDSR